MTAGEPRHLRPAALHRDAGGTDGDAPGLDMLVSSYGPVYGIVRGNGRWLYIADGVNDTD